MRCRIQLSFPSGAWAGDVIIVARQRMKLKLLVLLNTIIISTRVNEAVEAFSFSQVLRLCATIWVMVGLPSTNYYNHFYPNQGGC